MKEFRCTEPYEFIPLLQRATDKAQFLRDVSIFATYDFGSRTSFMMDYQQAAMQFLKDLSESACGETSDLFV